MLMQKHRKSVTLLKCESQVPDPTACFPRW